MIYYILMVILQGLRRGLESTGQAFFMVMLHEMLHAIGFSMPFFTKLVANHSVCAAL